MLFKCCECENNFIVCEQCVSKARNHEKSHIFTRLFSTSRAFQQRLHPVNLAMSYPKVQRKFPTEILDIIKKHEHKEEIIGYFNSIVEFTSVNDMKNKLKRKFPDAVDIVEFSVCIFFNVFGELELGQLPQWLRKDFDPGNLSNLNLQSLVWKLWHSTRMVNCKYYTPETSSMESKSVEELLTTEVIIKDLEIDLLPFPVMKLSPTKLLFNQHLTKYNKPLPENAIKLFISHRWFAKHAPDDEKLTDWDTILRFINSLLYLCIDVCVFFSSCFRIPLDQIKEFSRPLFNHYIYVNNDAMVSGLLLCDILQCAAILGTKLQSDPQQWSESLASHVFLWLDYVSLPQNEDDLTRSSCDNARFDRTLAELGPLQQRMHTIVVNTNDQYLKRYWCTAEMMSAQQSVSFTSGYSRVDFLFKDELFSQLFHRAKEKCTESFLNPYIPNSIEMIRHLKFENPNRDDPDEICQVLWVNVRDSFSNYHAILMSVLAADRQMITLAFGNYNRVLEYLEFMLNRNATFEEWLQYRKEENSNIFTSDIKIAMYMPAMCPEISRSKIDFREFLKALKIVLLKLKSEDSDQEGRRVEICVTTKFSTPSGYLMLAFLGTFQDDFYGFNVNTVRPPVLYLPLPY